MYGNLKYFLVFFCILVIAAGLRFPQLGRRPMHTDEAVQGMKFCQLLEKGTYRYDREEYHGPILNYMTLPMARLRGIDSADKLDESTLRSVPALAGMLCILLLVFLRRELGGPETLLAAMIMAVSPAMVFYNRYYIHESFMVLFTMGLLVCLLRARRNGNLFWYCVGGISLGLLIATKETWIIHLGVLVPAIVLARWYTIGSGQQARGLTIRGLIIMLVVAMVLASIFYSSFFSNMSGIPDALSSLVNYTGRAVSDPDHQHGFFYYIGRLIWSTHPAGMIWSEAWVLAGALAGSILFINGWNRKQGSGYTISLIMIYGLLLFLAYSIIPYKTPWILINFYSIMIILCAFVMARIYRVLKRSWQRRIMIFLTGILILFTSVQAWFTVYRYGWDPLNPFVYSHPTEDVLEISDIVHRLDREYDGNLYVEVIFPDHEFWPLPWYFRDLDSVGYWNKPDTTFPAAPVVLADPAAEPELLRKWYDIPEPGQKNLYVPLFNRTMEIRHGVEIRGYVQRDLMYR